MKTNLIGMILNHAGKHNFDGLIMNDDGVKLDAIHSLDYMIMEYAKVRNGGQSDTVTIPSIVNKELTPPNSPKLRPQVDAFAKAMESKLRLNEHKGGWESDCPDWLLDKLSVSFVKLCKEVSINRGLVKKEAVDVANYAMMIYDIADDIAELLEPTTTPPPNQTPEA